MANCLVLGANGFIGSHLVDMLVAKGHRVKAFDRFSDRPINFNSHKNIKIVNGNFLNRSDLSSALDDIDFVFHFISTTTPITSENDPLIDVETNIKMSIELFEECVKNKKLKKIIFASTGGAIYGNTNKSGLMSEDTLPNPISPYAIGKLTIENYLRYFEIKYGISSLVYRISNPYGARQSPLSKQGVIPIFLQHIVKNEPITIFGDGSMVRDYIYVEDVSSMIVESFEKAHKNLYNLGSGKGESVSELIDIIENVVGRKVQANHKDNPSTFIDRIVLDTSRFQNEFGLEPSIDLTSGINKTWRYILKHNEARV